MSYVIIMILVFTYIISPIYGFTQVTLPSEFWTFITAVTSVYIVGRSIEKIKNVQ